MASGEQIIALIRAHYNDDERKFRTLALQIAAEKAHKGHHKIASEIKVILEKAEPRKAKVRQINHLVYDINSPFFDTSFPNVKLSEMILSDQTYEAIDKLLYEYKNKRKLNSFGLANRRKVLLVGPPGTGKTMTANVAASELSLPLYSLRLDVVLTKFLGDTSKKLREIFKYISSNVGVFLLDEFDALGSKRSLDNDVGEMRRILNTFLQLLEDDTSDGLILCATNNPDLLDEALFRRFDDVIRYTNPTIEEICIIYSRFFSNYDIKYRASDRVLGESRGLSHAEVLNVCNEVVKDYVLHDLPVNDNTLLDIIHKRKHLYAAV